MLDTVSSETPWVMRRPSGTGVVHYGANGAGYELLYEWERLSADIGYLIRHLMPEQMSWDTLDVETREKFLSWAPNAKYALERAWLSRCKHPPVPPPRFFFSLLCSHRFVALWEGWVWRFLVARVLTTTTESSGRATVCSRPSSWVSLRLICRGPFLADRDPEQR